MDMKELLETYYKRFAAKANWDSVIADDFQYVGGDMTKIEPVTGKQAYIEVINRFSKVYQTMWVKKMIIQGENACVIGNYDLKFPNEKTINGDIAEIWTAIGGKLQSLRIYFDTLTFAQNSKM